MRLLSSWVASPRRGWSAEGWIVYLCEGESKCEAKPPHCFPLCSCLDQPERLLGDAKPHRPHPMSRWSPWPCSACPSPAAPTIAWHWPGCTPNPAPNKPQLFLLLSQIKIFSLGTAVWLSVFPSWGCASFAFPLLSSYTNSRFVCEKLSLLKAPGEYPGFPRLLG